MAEPLPTTDDDSFDICKLGSVEETTSVGCPSMEELFEAEDSEPSLDGPRLEPDSRGPDDVSLLDSEPPGSDWDETGRRVLPSEEPPEEVFEILSLVSSLSTNEVEVVVSEPAGCTGTSITAPEPEPEPVPEP